MRRTLVVLVPLLVATMSLVAVSERRAAVRAGYRVSALQARVERREDRVGVLRALVSRMCSPEHLAARARELRLATDTAVAVVRVAVSRRAEGVLAAVAPAGRAAGAAIRCR